MLLPSFLPRCGAAARVTNIMEVMFMFITLCQKSSSISCSSFLPTSDPALFMRISRPPRVSMLLATSSWADDSIVRSPDTAMALQPFSSAYFTSSLAVSALEK